MTSQVVDAPLDLRSGRFWYRLGNRVRVFEDPRSAVEDRAKFGLPTGIDEDFVRNFLATRIEDTTSPFKGVHRLPPGGRLIVREGAISAIRGAAIRQLPEPHLEGAEAKQVFMAAFDSAVSRIQSQSTALALKLSGGLDSTFVAASLANHATPERPIHAFVHVPVEEANQARHDEEDLVRDLASEYPGKFRITKIVNAAGVLGLDAAVEQEDRGWWPVLNPANQVWNNEITERAMELGAVSIITGNMGNHSFSHPHRYLLRDLLRQRSLLLSTQLAWIQVRRGASWRELASSLRANPAQTRRYCLSIGVPSPKEGPDEGAAPVVGRRDFIERLLGLRQPYASSNTPRAQRGLKVLDPFAFEEVVWASASIALPEWHRGPAPRAFARALGEGRVPDSIRLRRQRGLQSADAWWHIRNHRDRYFDEARQLADTPALGGWLDPTPTFERIESWPWGEPLGPPPSEINRVDRVLSIASFARRMTRELRALNPR